MKTFEVSMSAHPEKRVIVRHGDNAFLITPSEAIELGASLIRAANELKGEANRRPNVPVEFEAEMHTDGLHIVRASQDLTAPVEFIEED